MVASSANSILLTSQVTSYLQGSECITGTMVNNADYLSKQAQSIVGMHSSDDVNSEEELIKLYNQASALYSQASDLYEQFAKTDNTSQKDRAIYLFKTAKSKESEGLYTANELKITELLSRKSIYHQASALYDQASSISDISPSDKALYLYNAGKILGSAVIASEEIARCVGAHNIYNCFADLALYRKMSIFYKSASNVVGISPKDKARYLSRLVFSVYGTDLGRAYGLYSAYYEIDDLAILIYDEIYKSYNELETLYSNNDKAVYLSQAKKAKRKAAALKSN